MIKLLVTQEKFDENFSIDDWFHFGEMASVDLYKIMLQFVVNENDEYVTEAEARALFKKTKKSEWLEYVSAFITAVKEAFVNPTSGGS